MVCQGFYASILSIDKQVLAIRLAFGHNSGIPIKDQEDLFRRDRQIGDRDPDRIINGGHQGIEFSSLQVYDHKKIVHLSFVSLWHSFVNRDNQDSIFNY